MFAVELHCSGRHIFLFVCIAVTQLRLRRITSEQLGSRMCGLVTAEVWEVRSGSSVLVGGGSHVRREWSGDLSCVCLCEKS